MQLMQASHQWATRPDDQRFATLTDLHAFTQHQREISTAHGVSSKRLHVLPSEGDELKGLQVVGVDSDKPYAPTHWSFGQLATLSGAPAGYLRKLPAAIAADCVNWGLKERDAESVGVLTRENGNSEVAAATGINYGRVWNADISRALVGKFGDGVTGQWTVPGEFGKRVEITKENTTLYASDRDMFVFLADETNRIELPNRRNGQAGSMARGFFVWNSEVGSQSIGAAFFLFDYVCMNRIVWGVTEYKETRIRHTKTAPDRWLGEIAPTLAEYSNSASQPVIAAIEAARNKKLDDAKAWLANRYTTKLAARLDAVHQREEGRPIENLWDAATAITAHARTITHTDERVKLEREGGKLLDLAA